MAMSYCRRREQIFPASSCCRGWSIAPSVEHRGDRLVRHLARQGAHKLDDIAIGAPARPPSAVLLHRQTRMIAALPVNDQPSVSPTTSTMISEMTVR